MTDPEREFEFTIQSDLEAARKVQEQIEAIVKTAFEEHEAFAIKMAVEEALVNAIKHGNQLDLEKSVRVVGALRPDRFQIRITDEGPGFNPEDVPDPTAPENLERPCGRGLLLIRFYMSSVTFQDEGRTIVMHKSRNGAK
jgi:serine/threonine-protein kinase RsbW